MTPDRNDTAPVADDLHPARLLDLLGDAHADRSIVLLDRCASTNALAAEAASCGAAEGTVLIAHEQYAGRGRAGREWFSVPGAGLTFSIVLRPDRGAEGITALMGLTAAEVLDDLCGIVAVKWPNDLYLAGRKLGGILAEAKGDFVAVGLGINVNESLEDFSPEIAGDAISMCMHAGKRFDRGAVCAKILTRFAEGYAIWKRSGFAVFRAPLEDRLLYCGRAVEMLNGGNAVAGTLLGLTDEGYLRLGADDGELIVAAGDVSLRRGKEDR